MIQDNQQMVMMLENAKFIVGQLRRYLARNSFVLPYLQLAMNFIQLLNDYDEGSEITTISEITRFQYYDVK